MKLTKIFREFFDSEKAAGYILIGCTTISILIANSAWGHAYVSFWHNDIGGHTIEQWINDGLMTIFFLLIGLELERQIYIGELADVKNAMLPAFGALGGMLIPAGIYLLLNYQSPASNGAGIPMATDIAFAIGVMSLLGSRVPAMLKVFLTALAVIDDLGAILVIAFFYSDGIVMMNLAIALGIFFFLIALNRLKVHILWPYLVAGVFMWYFMLQSGVHATISGVLLAFAIPFGSGGEKTVSYRLQHFLHKPVSFFILPVFAFANTGIIIHADWMSELLTKPSLGIIVGLSVGKPLGVILFCAIAVMIGLAKIPPGIKWNHLLGAGMLAGIGFTMSIFITLIAFESEQQITDAKMAIVVASVISTIAGFTWLRLMTKNQEPENIAEDE